MQRLRPETQQPTLPLEMFLDEAGTSPGGTSPGGTPSTQNEPIGQWRTCRPSAVWKTLAQTDRERIKSCWTKMMREVLDERGD